MIRTIDEKESLVRSREEDDRCATKQPSLIKVVRINDKDQLIFVRYNAYVVLPWFTISLILTELDEEKLKNLVRNVFRIFLGESFYLFRQINSVSKR